MFLYVDGAELLLRFESILYDLCYGFVFSYCLVISVLFCSLLNVSRYCVDRADFGHIRDLQTTPVAGEFDRWVVDFVSGEYLRSFPLITTFC